ncbi:FG-GAP-like repeat-containing protein, partial [Shewanella sp. E94]
MRPTSWMMKLLFTVFFLFSFPANSVSGPTAPSLTGTKYSTSVQLDWNSINSCNATSYEIQESTNGSLWSTVYSGAGNSGGGSTGFARSARKARGGGCNVIGGGPRFISLSSRTNAVYYYKIRACELGRCGSYGTMLQLGQPTFIPAPTSITVPTGTENGNFLVFWSTVTGATRYELQQQFNNGSWLEKYSGNALGIGSSPSSSGSYKYRVKACNSIQCSSWQASSPVSVILRPSAPSSITTPSFDSNGSYTVSWSSVSGATYTLSESVNSGAWSTISSGSTNLSFSVSGRANGFYKYSVKACKSGLCSSVRTSNNVEVLHAPYTTVVTTPSLSTGVYDISWKPSVTATHYELSEKEEGGNWRTIGSQITGLSYHITGKESGIIYYKARACNRSGCSAWSAVKSTQVLHIPSSPASIYVPTSTVINGIIPVSWSATGEVTTYTLQESRNNASWITVSSSITGINYSRTGRTNGTYKYRIRACNASGCGGYRTSGNVTVHLPPPIPTSMNVPTSTSTNGTIALSWATASTATKYTLQELKSGGNWVTLSSTLTTTSYSRTGRDSGGYTYRIRACNSSGCSGYRASAVTYVVKTPSSISAPSNDADGAYSINWTAVSGATGYQLEQKVGSGGWSSIYTGTSVSKSISGQTNNTYQYRVKAKYGSVSGGYRTSSVVTVLLPPPVPSSISIPTSTVTNGSFTISWSATSTATSYTLAERINGGNWSYTTVSGVSKSYSGRGNASYQYAIRGCNTSACGGWKYSGTFNVLNKPGIPSTITIPLINYTSSFAVSWSAVNTATSYTLAQSVNGGGWTHETINGTSKNYINRTNATYRYAIRACNSSGCSSYKYSNTFTNTLSPSSISVPSTSTSGSFTISWAQVSTATSYALQESVNGGTWSTLASSTAINYSRTGRPTGSYKYQVRACNTSGCSGWRVSSSMTVLLPPPVPASLSVPTVTNTNGVIELAWAASTTATEYTLQEQKDGGAWESGTLAATSDTRAGRTNGNYIYRVRACNTSGCSNWRTSSTVTVLLPPTAPDSISVPTSTVTDGNVDISWAVSSSATSYNLQQNTNNGTWTALVSQGGTSYEQVLNVDGSYSYRVNACNTSGCSDWKTSPSVTVILPPAWRQTELVSVTDTGGGNTAPSETIDLTASVLKGKAGVSGGQASYQIPIDLPPGRNGIQPNVALSYNSQGGNDIAGVGWSLNAASAISRCGATEAQDGFTRAVTFNADTDRLCFNGQRLITLSSNDSYGTSGTEYRTEMDRFVRVVQSGEINGSSTSFTVHRPDGSQATYGSNANSRFVLGDLTTTLTWKVTQESWADGNNTIDYEYDTSVAGEHLLSKIYYTGSSGSHGDRIVEFIHENRTDNRKSYMAGGQLITQRRLKNINTYSGTSRQIAKYKVGYGLSDASKRSLLKNVQQCGFNSGTEQCSPLTRFSWSETASKVVLGEYTVIDDGISKYPLRGLSGEKFQAILPFGDIDGDGTLDSLSYYTSAEQAVIREHEIELNNSAFDNLTFSTTTVMFDANQDGKTDNFKVDAGYLHIALSTTDGIGPFFNTGVSMPEIKDALLNAADYNGDGWPDLIIRKGQQPAYSNAKLYLYPHSGNANSPYSESQRQLVHTYGYNASNPGSPFDGISFVGDADGNGLPDILITNKVLENAFGVSSSWPRTFLLNQGGSFSSKNLPYLSRNTGIDSELFEFMMDINGDGLVDWLYWERNEAKPNQPNELWYRLNNGKAEFTEAVSFNQAVLESRSYATLANNAGEESIEFSFPKYSSAFKVMDIDGDGVPELLTPGERLLESCGKIYHGTVLKQVCGDEIYEQYQVAHTPGVNRPIPLGLDKSIYRYNAIKFEFNANGQIEPVTVNTSFIGTPQASMVDMFGDGLVDMLFVFKTHVNTAIYPNLASSNLVAEEGHYISRNYGAGNGNSYSDYAATDYLKSVTDGIGNQSSWRYRPLSTGESSAGQPEMYHTDHDYVGDGYIHFGSSMYVVQSFEQSNGVNGTNETEYGYKGAMYNLQGRGFTGFREIIEKDVARNRVTTSVFKQKFPEVSLLESQTVKIDGTTVATTQQTWAENPQHNISGVYHNINTSTVTHSYGLSGSSEQRSSVEQTIATADVTEHGNIKKRIKTVTDYIDGGANSYQTVVDTVFIPDTNNWFLGKFESKTTTTSVTARGWASDPYANTDTEQWQTFTVDSWDAEHHKPTQATYTASSSCSRVESTALNSYGLPTQVSVTGDSSSCGALTARSTSFTYTKNGSSQADDGYQPYKVTNAKGHVTT